MESSPESATRSYGRVAHRECWLQSPSAGVANHREATGRTAASQSSAWREGRAQKTPARADTGAAVTSPYRLHTHATSASRIVRLIHLYAPPPTSPIRRAAGESRRRPRQTHSATSLASSVATKE